MPLLQLGITYDDIFNNKTFSYFPQSNKGIVLSPIPNSVIPSILPQFSCKVLRNVNLPAGRYKCTIVGVDVCSGFVDTVTFNFQPQIINIKSPQFLRIGGGGQGLGFCFSNNNSYSNQDFGGERSFLMNLAGNWIELEMTICQFQAMTGNNTISASSSWGSTQFAFFIMTLNVELEDVKALFGNAK